MRLELLLGRVGVVMRVRLRLELGLGRVWIGVEESWVWGWTKG